MSNTEYWSILECPYCKGSLLDTGNGAKCTDCNEHYSLTNVGQLDLRLKREKFSLLRFPIAKELDDNNVAFTPLKEKSDPSVDFSQMQVPYHLSKQLMSHFPKGHGGFVLDLGCGEAIHRAVCEHAGFKYIGLDYDSTRASILGDAHSLPFKDDSIDFILSIAVLEHLQYPFLAATAP